MQRAFEKIVERLRDSGERYEDIAFAEMNENGQTLDFEYAHGKKDAMLEAIEIVNQVASEYGDFEIFTKEQLANIEQMNIDTFNRMVALKHNSGGWIPVSSGKLPEENVAVDVTIEEEIEGSTYTEVSWLQDGQWVIKKNPFRPRVTAWRMRPEPYKAESEG